MQISGSLATYVIADALAKRDTTTITSSPIPVDGMRTKRMLLRTTLNQGFNIKSEILINGTWYQAGTAKAISASAGTAIYLETDGNLLGLGLIGGSIRFVIDTFAGAPTSGELIVRLDMMTV